MSDIRRIVHDEKGATLIELLIAMPMVSIMLLSMAVFLAYGLKTYVIALSDFEMQKEIQFSMEAIQHDLMYAIDAKAEPGVLRIKKPGGAFGTWLSYGVKEGRMIKGIQPMTGETTLGNIIIVSFECAKYGEKTVRYSIKARNSLTGREYELRSATTLP